MTKKVALPKYKDTVAPRFETANVILICTLGEGDEISTEVVECRGCEGFTRARVICDRKADVLICGGIRNFYRNLFHSEGVEVVSGVELPVKEALSEYLSGNLAIDEPLESETSVRIPHEDLLGWAKGLFESSGYRVRDVADSASFPVDLIAEITCPVCGRQINVAICCGAHLYRTDQEIKEFHHIDSADIQAKVFIYPRESRIERYCSACGIQLIDPSLDNFESDNKRRDRVPLLRGVIKGHESVSVRE